MAEQVETRRIRTIVEYDDRQLRAGAPRSARSLQNLQQQSQGASSRLDDVAGAGSRAGRGLRSTSNSAGLLSGSLGTVGAVVGGLAAGFVTMEAARAAVRWTETGNQVRRTRDELEALAGSQQGLTDSTEAVIAGSDRALTTYEAQKSAVALLGTEIATTTDELEQLTEIAVQLGDKELAPQQRIEVFSKLISNRSIERLDTFNFAVGRLRERMDELEDAGRSADEAFKLALIEQGTARLETFKDVGVTTTTGLERLKRELMDIGQQAAPTFTQGIDAAAGATADWLADMRSAVDQQEHVNAAYDAAIQKLHEMGRQDVIQEFDAEFNTGNTEEALRILRQYPAAMRAFERAFESGSAAVERNADVFERGTTAADQFSATLARLNRMDMTSGLRDLAGWMDTVIGRTSALSTSLSGLPGAVSGALDARAAADPRFGAELAQRRFTSARQGLAAATASGDPTRIAAAYEDLYSAQQDVIDANSRYQSSIQRTTSSAVGRLTEQEKAVNRIEQAWDSAISKIRSTAQAQLDLSGGAVTEEDMILTRAGLYQEKPGEAARRLQSIINDPSDQAVRFFPELQGIKDLEQRRAQAILTKRRFQKGLRPDLINVDALTEQTAQALEGQQNLDKIFDQVTQNLLDRGFGESEVQQVLGDQLGATDFISPLVETNKKALEQQKQQFQTMGDQAADVIVTAAEKRFGKGKLLDALIKVFASEINEIMQAETTQ